MYYEIYKITVKCSKQAALLSWIVGTFICVISIFIFNIENDASVILIIFLVAFIIKMVSQLLLLSIFMGKKGIY